MICISDVSLTYGNTRILKNVDIKLQSGKPLALIGESGAGKSSLALVMMGMAHGDVSGTIDIDGFNVIGANEKQLRQYRGNLAAIVFQHLSDVLNPQVSILDQVAEPAVSHGIMGKRQAMAKAEHLLRQFDIPSDTHRCRPKRFSGGQVQRIMLAMALINEPDLLILDEPTAALDPMTKQSFIQYMQKMVKGRHVLIITHDLGLAKELTTETAILYAGSVLETGATLDVLSAPLHPYTRGLVRARPSSERRKDLQGIPGRHVPVDSGCVFSPRCTQKDANCRKTIPALRGVCGHRVACHRGGIVTNLSVRGIVKSYDGSLLLNNLSFSLLEGESLAIVGQSGCGKSTLLRILMGLENSDGGDNVTGRQEQHGAAKIMSKAMGYIPQHPRAAMSRRFSILDIVREPLDIQGNLSKKDRKDRVLEALVDCQLPVSENFLKSRINMLSGGELQRVAMARALVIQPKIIIADEPTSALDVSVQAKVMKLLLTLQELKGLSMLIVTHDIELAHKVADRIVVLKEGRLQKVEAS